jgi:hypothetical protein
MSLSEPRQALADQSTFIGYLVGLAGLARIVHELAEGGDRSCDPRLDPDDFVYALVGVASVGAAITRLAKPPTAQDKSHPPADPPIVRWLR